MITLDSNYDIEVGTCYMLRKRSGRTEDGMPAYETVGYYAEIEKALAAYSRQMYRDGFIAAGDITIGEAIAIIQASNNDLESRIAAAIWRRNHIDMRAEEVNGYAD